MCLCHSLIQTHLGCLQLQDFALLQDVNIIMRAATRISHCTSTITVSVATTVSVLFDCLFGRRVKVPFHQSQKFPCRPLDTWPNRRLPRKIGESDKNRKNSSVSVYFLYHCWCDRRVLVWWLKRWTDS